MEPVPRKAYSRSAFGRPQEDTGGGYEWGARTAAWNGTGLRETACVPSARLEPNSVHRRTDGE
ncbi:hypothetical protein [Halogeometricum luteum]|uniref:Uncharacterized protein n=1 Tax=Halogeometricum luteum TaxID=2950537 RepID=A0ABU2G6S3_9EURY|nr:hypothetical protein [Halogeometricum sp. S3BR5-2]MDS0296486.1 hypothetical protein [Halogeometricum sp. S3BR5-2]